MIEVSVKTGFCVALNLRLPSGQLASRSTAVTLHAAIRLAFEDLGAQLGKHKDHLRSQYKFPGVRGGLRGDDRQPIEPQARFEDTVAAVKPDKVSNLDVTNFVNANFERLRRYVERELAFRRDNGQSRLAAISVEEVIDEAIANALDDHNPRPEKIGLEPWLYRLSRSAMDRLANQMDAAGLPVGRSAENGMLDARDEERMQFYHPDESSPGSDDMIPDRYSRSPEEEASREELMGIVERVLRGVTPQQREAFLLATVEGFRPAEIAAITARELNQVEADIRAARNHLRKSMQANGENARNVTVDASMQRPRIA
jgi:RNA polymerase sigma factor (sigma-70 family)